MLFRRIFRLGLVLGCLLFGYASVADAQTDSLAPVLTGASPEKSLFDTAGILHITLSGALRPLLADRLENQPKYPLFLSYFQDDSSKITLPVEVKTRGHFRRLQGNCTYPPLLIHFPQNDAQQASIFREQRKLKLVMPCAEDKYIIREWLVYRLYNLVTPKSFRARLVRVQLIDDQSKKPADPFYGILLEEEKQMAKRNQMMVVERRLQPKQTQIDAFLNLAVFEYLIGNTDWSIQYQHNIKLLATEATPAPIAVPYDFDHAGIVNAPYAQPAEELQLRSVRERRYRGYCMPDEQIFVNVITQYNHLKSDIYRLYTGCDLLDEKYVKSTVQYLDEFYTTINNPPAWSKAFAYPCEPNGTGNVVIRGLKKN